jgi:hypothetical protein
MVDLLLFRVDTMEPMTVLLCQHEKLLLLLLSNIHEDAMLLQQPKTCDDTFRRKTCHYRGPLTHIPEKNNIIGVFIHNSTKCNCFFQKY